ncbi:PREDICTED: interleukin-1 receptor-like 2 isoform X1 [Myotis brandtii]|uniref:interleukin-1 receptor-like 2 isoform X1 n=1 Tax=Myotis brandtii TaxID=109478 RepID=UPI0003BBADD1|nr:PREDICTED: interleukin-1 receptor-like 2 isoform X1 [Myotis brandtii]XP_014397355.1 PREDICTED: interleukin-1 receptor-like 2 isoform X1 [Myotis brandtii]XP_014397356.1 PREDICTED: interleukin-1 receptor-like 2 isoform X1 [Myotis brandtii]
MGAASLLLCVSVALPLLLGADECQDIRVLTEASSAKQPFAFSCTSPLLTSGKARVTWYRHPSKVPVSTDWQARIHQEQSWLVFLPVAWGDSGTYRCVINDTDGCRQVHVNLTVFKKYGCGMSRNSQMNFPDGHEQILHVGKDDSLTCHLNFPKSCILDPVKWYKDCKEIKGERFIYWEKKLLVNNVSEEDRGSYACKASLTHAGRQFTVSRRIAVNVTENVGHEGRIPNITYPTNNTIEAQLGSTLTVNCTIIDSRDNTNLRSWRVGSTWVDVYYQESKRVQEGNETHVAFKEHAVYTVGITFLEVKMEDYGRPFTCHAGVSAAYFMLKPPAPDGRAYLIGGLLAITGAAALLLCVSSRFRIDIVLWYRSAFHSAGTIADGKLYDAYVLYPKPLRDCRSSDVDTLVLRALPEVLERQCGYKLFIFGRDEFPGQAVANVIDENIKLCRRLIIILVPEPLGFDLLKNMSEEQIAIYNALIQDGMKVILIEVEKVESYASMPESIQYLRQKHGSVQWSRDFTAQSPCAKARFWKKVRYLMPPKRFPPPSPASC